MRRWRHRVGNPVVLILGLTAIIGTGAFVARAAPPVSPPGYEVVANVNGTEIPVSVGSAVAAGHKEGDLCVIDQEIGVHIEMTEGDVTPIVAWKLDDQCRLVITSIEDEQ